MDIEEMDFPGFYNTHLIILTVLFSVIVPRSGYAQHFTYPLLTVESLLLTISMTYFMDFPFWFLKCLVCILFNFPVTFTCYLTQLLHLFKSISYAFITFLLISRIFRHGRCQNKYDMYPVRNSSLIGKAEKRDYNEISQCHRRSHVSKTSGISLCLLLILWIDPDIVLLLLLFVCFDSGWVCFVLFLCFVFVSRYIARLMRNNSQ